MARRVHGYAPKSLRAYVPQAFGNHLEADPVRVWIRTPTAGEKRQVLAGLTSARFAVGADGRPALDAEGRPLMHVDMGQVDQRQRNIVVAFVEKVEQYLKPDDSPILTGADLAEHGEDAIVAEVADEILLASSLGEEQKKSCAAPSASSPAVTSPSAGTATLVDVADSTSPGAAVAYEAPAES
jgi:hypothetical protein